MLYKDYKNSARKHEYTCDVLFKELNELNEKIYAAKYRSLVLNLYYLSGYIIECIVKYGIYDLIGYRKDRRVTELDENGLTYHDHIQHHRFDRYTEHLNRRISVSIPLINDNKINKKRIDNKVIELYRQWDPRIRYSYDLKVKETCHYISFYKYAKKIHKNILQNIRG